MSRMVIVSLILATSLMAAIGWEVQGPSQYGEEDTAGHQARPNLTPGMPVAAAADPVDAWVATSLGRPLLRESRRPDRAADDVEKKPDDILRLAGVVTGPFGDRAIFVLPGVVKPVVANVGAQLNDFVVRSIEPGRVIVEANGVARTFRPMYSGSTRKPAVASKRL